MKPMSQWGRKEYEVVRGIWKRVMGGTERNGNGCLMFATMLERTQKKIFRIQKLLHHATRRNSPPHELPIARLG